MITLDEVIKKIKSGATLQLRFYLAGGLFSVHELWFDDGRIFDFSYVDSTESSWTEKQYRSSFYATAFIKHSVKLMEVYK
jgi:hypothetical protein